MNRVSITGPGLYAIVDPTLTPDRDAVGLATAILRGGCCALQLRYKEKSDRDFVSLARQLRDLTREAGVPFIVNDRVDIAILVDADGVHLGQDDLSLLDARRLSNMHVGISTHDLHQAKLAADLGADLIGFGPVFNTRSKDNPDPTVGLSRVARVAAEVKVPVVAIGGITTERARSVREMGVKLVAAISSVAHASSPGAVAKEIHTIMQDMH